MIPKIEKAFLEVMLNFMQAQMVDRQNNLQNLKPLVEKMAKDFENGEAINMQFSYAERIRLLCYILQLELQHDKLPERQ